METISYERHQELRELAVDAIPALLKVGIEEGRDWLAAIHLGEDDLLPSPELGAQNGSVVFIASLGMEVPGWDTHAHARDEDGAVANQALVDAGVEALGIQTMRSLLIVQIFEESD